MPDEEEDGGEPVLMGAKTLALIAGGGFTANLTKTIHFKGPQTAGVLLSFPIDFDGILVFICAYSNVLISRGRSWASIAAGSFTTDGSVIAGIGSNSNVWHGRERVHKGDRIYLDSAGGLGTSDQISFVFIPDVV